MSENNPPKVALLILDGWGINHNPAVSAIEAASTPFMDSLIKTYPNNVLTTFGEKLVCLKVRWAILKWDI